MARSDVGSAQSGSRRSFATACRSKQRGASGTCSSFKNIPRHGAIDERSRPSLTVVSQALLCAALAILQCTQERLLKLAFDDMLPFFKSMGRLIKPLELAEALAKISVETKLYDELALEYQDPAASSLFDAHFR